MAYPQQPAPELDPPFRGFVETTYDALLIFEAARRGMVPRVTRRLIERERGMVQSGAVFVFDEHESGIRRWTDGYVWSPSRILGNFLVYREQEKDKRANGASDFAGPSGLSISTSTQVVDEQKSALAGGALVRPRSSSDGNGVPDKQLERQLVGSLTDESQYKAGGLVKKTMSIVINGFSQHMISYYKLDDIYAHRLRTPSSIPEFASLEISPEYLDRRNFRVPPMVEMGPDGILRYRGEGDETQSPISASQKSLASPTYNMSGMPVFDPQMQQPRRTVTGPMAVPIANQHYPPPGPDMYAQSSSLPNGMMHGHPQLVRQSSASSVPSANRVVRPGSSSRRYDPYSHSASTSPRPSSMMSQAQRRPSIPQTIQPPATAMSTASYDYHPPSTGHSSAPPQTPNPFHYQPPGTAPSSFGDFYHASSNTIVESPLNGQSPYVGSTYWPPSTSHGHHAPVQDRSGYGMVPPNTGQHSSQWGAPPPLSDAPPMSYVPPNSAGGVTDVGGWKPEPGENLV